MAFTTSLTKVIDSNMANRNSFTHIVCKEDVQIINVVIYFSKNFYLIDKIDATLNSLLSSGIVKHVVDKYVDLRYLKTRNVDKGPQKLTLKHLEGAFNIWIILCFVSITAFVFECYYDLVYQKACKIICPIGLEI